MLHEQIRVDLHGLVASEAAVAAATSGGRATRPGINGIIMVSTMLQLPNNGAPWRGTPERYDPRRTAATRVLLVDRGYTGRAVCDYRRRRSIMAIIPQLSTETRARLMDWPNLPRAQQRRAPDWSA